MYRIKYLFGIFSAAFGALYLLFGIVGWENALTSMDKYTSFVLCFVHSSAAALLFMSSARDKKKLHTRLDSIMDAMLLVHPTVSPELFAQESGLSVPDASEYIEQLVKRHSKQQSSSANV